eukprot:scaffold315_cov101-Isochrysis_galbana.AAC.3
MATVHLPGVRLSPRQRQLSCVEYPLSITGLACPSPRQRQLSCIEGCLAVAFGTLFLPAVPAI